MPTKTVRIQFEIPEDRLESLDALMEEAGIKTRTELFNNAMTLLKWTIRQRREGRKIASVNYEENSFIELEMPIFEYVEEKARAKDNEASDDESSS